MHGILSSILESHEEEHVRILGDFNATSGLRRFNEICDMLHENSVMFRDTYILADNTYTHVNNGSQTCSWLDHIAMSDVLSSLLLTAAPSRMSFVQITVLLQLHLTLTNCR